MEAKFALLDKLARSIFNKSFASTRGKEKGFIFDQAGEHKKYTEFIRKKALPILGRGKLKTREYELINEWFFRNIPLFCVKNGMDKCLDRAKVSGKPIFSLAFFKPDILGEFRRHLKMMRGGRFFVDPWGYQEWKENENGKK